VDVNQTVALGSALSWSGINMTDSGGDITFSAGSTLTLGAAGFTSAANKWIFINPAVALGAPQTWTTPNNLFVYGVVSGASALTKNGSAALTLTNANSISGGINVTAGQLTTKNGSDTTDPVRGLICILFKKIHKFTDHCHILLMRQSVCFREL
jgi:autotransporter-associated beta strand protein